MGLIKKILKESFPVLFLCTVGGVLAGVILQDMEMDLKETPGILILLPAILGMRGNISGALGSRLASALHLGLISPELRWNKPLSDNFWASIILNVVMSFLLGIVAFLTCVATGYEGASVIQLTAISLIAGTLAGLILTFLSIFLALVTFSRGLDPDNVLMPSLSTVGDIITILCLLVAVRIVRYLVQLGINL